MKTFELTGPAASEKAIQDGQHEDVMVLRDGKPVALVTPFDDDDFAWYVKEREQEFIDSIALARQQVRSGQIISHEELSAE